MFANDINYLASTFGATKDNGPSIHKIYKTYIRLTKSHLALEVFKRALWDAHCRREVRLLTLDRPEALPKEERELSTIIGLNGRKFHLISI